MVFLALIPVLYTFGLSRYTIPFTLTSKKLNFSLFVPKNVYFKVEIKFWICFAHLLMKYLHTYFSITSLAAKQPKQWNSYSKLWPTPYQTGTLTLQCTDGPVIVFYVHEFWHEFMEDKTQIVVLGAELICVGNIENPQVKLFPRDH